jgi:hypothetical protein
MQTYNIKMSKLELNKLENFEDVNETTNTNTDNTNTETTNTETTNTDNTNTDNTNTDNTTTETTNIDDTQVVDFVTQIFRNSGLQMLLAFLVIYLVVFVFFGMYLRRNDQQTAETTISRTFDFAVFGSLFVFLVYKYYSADESDRKNVLNLSVQELVSYYEDPLSLFTTMLFVVTFYIIVFLLRVPTKDHKPFSVTLMEVIGWFLVGTLVIHNGLKYLFGVDLINELRDPKYQKYLDPTSEDDIQTDASGNVIEPPIEIVKKPEVFNISNNLYSYDDAQAICKAYDARLATYDEIETAYNNGAEWCNYGWSSGQMAFFPTQKETWNELQNSETHKNSCGRPGVNGGYFANPNIKFGVNCYGVKPEPTQTDLDMMNTKQLRPYPRTEAEKAMDEKVEYWKNNMEGNLNVNSFNRVKWSRGSTVS